jgi:hypothetical protein
MKCMVIYMSNTEEQLSKILDVLLAYVTQLNICVLDTTSERERDKFLERSRHITELSRWLNDFLPLLVSSREHATLLGIWGKELDWSFDKPDCPHTAIYLKKRT